MKFRVFDRVRWTSSSQGHKKTKEGTVIAIVPERVFVRERLPEGFKERGFYGGLRKHESYLVQVGQSKRLYWPRVSAMKRAR